MKVVKFEFKKSWRWIKRKGLVWHNFFYFQMTTATTHYWLLRVSSRYFLNVLHNTRMRARDFFQCVSFVVHALFLFNIYCNYVLLNYFWSFFNTLMFHKLILVSRPLLLILYAILVPLSFTTGCGFPINSSLCRDLSTVVYTHYMLKLFVDRQHWLGAKFEYHFEYLFELQF